MTLRTPPAASKVHQNNETTKAKKDDTNIHVLNWEDHLWESKIYIHFQPQKRASNKSNNLICRPDSARKRKMRKMLFWNFWSFQFQSRWQGVWDFLRFLRFSVYYAIYKMNRGFEIFEVFSFNRTDKVFEIFLSNGDSGYYNTIRRGPKQVATKGPAIIPPKALRILVRICSQVPAKVQSALLVACVRSLEGRREGSPKNKQRIKRPKQNWAVRRPIVTKRSTANANAMSQQNQHLTHATLRKPATTTPKQFQTT